MSVNINHQLEQVNNLKITTVGTGASVGTAGIVTYYGDGSQLSGISAGGSGITTDAQGNTYAGELAGGSFSGTSAQYNTLFGYDAGGDITIGDYNTCIGWTAGDKITEGTKNVALGAEALDNCTTGSSNVAVGWEAGRSLISGDNNVMVGDMAGRTASFWTRTIAIGPSAASNHGTITDGIAIGYNALRNGGNYSIAIGYRAAYSQRNSEYSVYIGYQSGGVNLATSPWGSGNNNVAVGRDSLGNIRSGHTNTALGYSAGLGLTSGYNNTLIGYNAAASSPSASNEVVIGDLNVTKFSIPGIGVTLKDNGGTPTQGHVLTVDANGEASFAAASGGSGISSISEDTTPQLGGNLETNGNDIKFADTDQAIFGTGDDLKINHSGTNSYISHSGTGNLYIRNATDDQDIVIQTDNGSGSYTSYFLADGSTGEAILSHYGSAKLTTKSTGISVTGNVSATSFSGDGSGLTNITATGSGVGIQSNTSTVGTAQTINFGTNLAATISGGVATITATGGGGGSSTTRSVNRYVANNGDTLFPPSGTVSYDVGYIDVYLNGSKLDSTEYTATNGTTITLTTGASQSDIIELVAYTSVNLANVEVVNDTTPQLGGNLDLNGNTISDGTDGGTLVNREEAIAYAIAFG
tara:strand:- start:2923 stop:4836 length:1914 start_codon:yes stop_codon:yes gene_type:complete